VPGRYNPPMDSSRTRNTVDGLFDASIIPTLCDYIRIPNLSPYFDKQWVENGHMDRAVDLAAKWVGAQGIPGLKHEVVRMPGRTPVLFIEIPGDAPGTVLLYGHLDKQPPMLPWAEGLDPFTPVIRDGKLYGRGGADDGYAVFASVAAAKALKDQGIRHARLVMVIECCEESGSYDLPAYIDHLAARIGSPELVVCLDSGCGDYERLWVTTSLRGLVAGDLTVELLREGIHSGDGGGLVASSFRVLRRLLERLEDSDTGTIIPKDFHVRIPTDRIRQVGLTAEVLGDTIAGKLPLHAGVRPVTDDPVELMLNRTWRPSLAVTGVDGLPPLSSAGNVLRPKTAFKLSLRVPPTADADACAEALKKLLEADPPYGAKVTFNPEKSGSGWNAPAFAPWLEQAVDAASREYFGQPSVCMGEGGSIPFMGMLGKKFPKAQFLITGVLGPHSNAHGPNEFLEIATARRLTACVAHVIEAHARR
jgi:acetylornithine deacetylase/succinyl-diaminopimelate desuccinylase-like protein